MYTTRYLDTGDRLRPNQIKPHVMCDIRVTHAAFSVTRGEGGCHIGSRTTLINLRIGHSTIVK